MRRSLIAVAVGSALLALAGNASAQGKASKTTQVVKPPVAQAWIDVATFSGMMGGMPGAGVMEGLSGLFGGKKDGGNRFGMTQAGSSGRWLDVTLSTRKNPSLTEGLQSVPTGSKLAPTLALVATPPDKPKAVPESDDEVSEPEPMERPKGKIYFYWGCGETVRSGQPKVLDMSKASPTDFAKFFQARRATQRGAHQGAGKPVWPNARDTRKVPEGASLVGEHAFSGDGVPESFRFPIGAQQDFMPAIDLKQRDSGNATQLEWTALPTARAYFLSAMGARGEQEMVFWSSSEVPETGFGLMDYQTNPAVDRWLGEKVLLPPSTQKCAIPKEVFGDKGAMLRMIAYGNEASVAYPPRPSDPKIAWEPEWSARIRVKSVTNTMLGMPGMGDAMRGEESGQKPQQQSPGALDLLKGILGR
ncbi:hypothetical protein [Niveibacterium microcysteis]|uniref:Uncharacterized protein n=1 Tax=Niveibacterium microcysteis TaxID=2811415 RepID=A0ABX7MB14_9RHOO|nr:hypothetical protein [Niveibacterium microcysteis]QSI78912.1 hypothetical protein JY500_09995 [Niveibacterium microcysteis]